MLTFYELRINHQILRAVEEMGFEETTPIQEKAIPVALKGSDLIGQAQTGTGKTAAFTIPALENMDAVELKVQVLVLTPTRELAIQVSEEVNKIGKYMGVRSLPIYGGQDINRQIRALKSRPQFLVATPGRLIDHINRSTIRLNELRTVVLDEADEMLNMGFLEDIELILSKCPKDKQTLMFSATIRPEIKALATKYMHHPDFITVKGHQVTVPEIEQVYYEVQEKLKFDVLCRLFDIQSPELAMVFGRTKRRVDELTDALQKRGYLAEGIHGDLSQKQRDTVMQKFRSGKIEILVATDVAARGLDITGVTHVYNFDMPQDVDSYVHRIGRTGRAGRTGLASTFVEPREVGHLHQLEQIIKKKIAKKPIPTIAEAKKERQKLVVNRIVSAIEEGKAQEFNYLAEQVLNDYDSITALAAAMQLLSREDNDAIIQLTEEQPLRVKKPSSKTNYNRQRYDKDKSRRKVKF